jgi:hypothetical protein
MVKIGIIFLVLMVVILVTSNFILASVMANDIVVSDVMAGICGLAGLVLLVRGLRK